MEDQKMEDNEEIEIFAQEASGTLPNGLRLVAIEFELYRWDEKFGWDQVASWDDVCYDVHSYFSAVGTMATTFRKDRNLFGAQPHERFRLDIVASPEVLRTWVLSENGEYCWKREFKFTHANKHFALKVSKVQQLTSMAHWYDEAIEDIPGYEFTYRNVDQEGFKSGKDGREFAPGDFARWITAAQTTAVDFERLTALTEACCNDILIAGATVARREALPGPQQFLVPGLIPRGAVTLLLGNKKVGKSAIALELAVAVARREAEWLGFPLDKEKIRGFAVYLSGEDSQETAMERMSLMSQGDNPMMLQIIPADGGEIDTLLDRLKKQRVDLLIVDPARKYYKAMKTAPMQRASFSPS
jgi:AAA domain